MGLECNKVTPNTGILHANSSYSDSNHYSGRRSRCPAADSHANSVAFPDSVWRNPYTLAHAYTHSNTNTSISAYSKTDAVSIAQPDPLGQSDANPYAKPVAPGFPDGKPAAAAG